MDTAWRKRGRGGDTGVRKLDLDAGGHGRKKVLVVWV